MTLSPEREIMRLLHILFLVIFLYFPSTALSTELTLLTWEDYVSQNVLDAFFQKTGIKIKQVYFDTDQTRDEIMASSRGERFDLVIFGNISAQIFGKNNLLQAISKSEVSNISNIADRWKESCGNFGVPYFYGTVGIAYDKTKFTQAPDSWNDLLDPRPEHRGHVAMIKDKTDMFVAPLIYLGHNINSEQNEELKAAYKLLQKQVPSVLNYTYALTNISIKGIGEKMHMALVYNGDEETLNEFTETENWQYIIPKEGTAVWLDCMTIPTGAAYKKEALEFINFINTVEVAAQNTEDVYNAPCVAGVKEYVSAETAMDANLFPSEEMLDNWQMYRIISNGNLRQRIRIMDAIINQHETQ